MTRTNNLEHSVPQKALITGITGQTGAYLAQHLLTQGYEVHGTSRAPETPSWRLKYLRIADKVTMHGMSGNTLSPFEKIVGHNFDSIFHLAAESSVANSLKHPSATVTANLWQTTSWLEVIKTQSPETRFFNALTSEVLKYQDTLLDETSECLATNPYAVTKLAAMQMARVFRDSFDLYVVNGLLFNHESELRDTRFVTAKIVVNLCALARDASLAPFELGNVLAERDFSHAEDFAKGIAASLDVSEPQDYVFASGQRRSVRGFFNETAKQLGFSPEWKGEGVETVCHDAVSGRLLVKTNPAFFRPVDEQGKKGNPARAMNTLNWQRQIGFEDMIARMIKFHQARLASV
jgi:GDPmannose 4,6-dehydratase